MMKYSVVNVNVEEYDNLIKIEIDNPITFMDMERVVKRFCLSSLKPLLRRHQQHLFINTDLQLILDFKNEQKNICVDMTKAFRYEESVILFYEGFLEYAFK